MFAYCNNNPANFKDSSGKIPDSFAGQFGELLSEFLYELFTGDDHPSNETESVERTIIEKQNEQIGQAGNALLDSFMRWCNHQEEAQRAEAQLMSTVTPRIITAGLESGTEAALLTGGVEIAKRAKDGGQGTDPYDVAATFVVGFLIGAGKEIWKIFKETFE